MVLDPRHPLIEHFNAVVEYFNAVVEYCDSFLDLGNAADQAFHRDSQISDIASEPCRNSQDEACQRNAYRYDSD